MANPWRAELSDRVTDWWVSGAKMHGIERDRLETYVDELLGEGTPARLAATRAELERLARRLGAEVADTAVIRELSDRASAELTRRLVGDDRLEASSYEHTLAQQILGALVEVPRSPSALADFLDVDISQISRAARRLRDHGLIDVESDTGDRRRRVYRALNPTPSIEARTADHISYALDAVRRTETVSDMVPDRVGDHVGALRFHLLTDAFRNDLRHGAYDPTEAHSVDIPKPRGGTRPAAALRYADRLAFAALVAQCRHSIESGLGPAEQVLWPRGLDGPTRWPELENFVATVNYDYVLTVDIQSFYDSIDHEVLSEALGRSGCDKGIISSLIGWLGAICGRRQGLPQGLSPSDPLASIVLASIDAELTKLEVPFVRHGDDMRCAVHSQSDARDLAHQIGFRLRELGLQLNTEMTRPVRTEAYLAHRTEISTAVEEYLRSMRLDRDSPQIYDLLEALGADEELKWGWYHGNLRVDEVLEDVGPNVEPGDERALLLVLDAVAAEQDRMDRWRTTLRDKKRNVFLMQAGMSLMAEWGVDEGIDHLQPWLVARPEYSDALSTFVEAIAPKNPGGVARLLDKVEQTGVAHDAQWLRLYAALGAEGGQGEFDTLSRTHATTESRDWTLRVRAATFMAERNRPGLPDVDTLARCAPDALRDDALSLVRIAEPALFSQLIDDEGSVVAALLSS